MILKLRTLDVLRLWRFVCISKAGSVCIIVHLSFVHAVYLIITHTAWELASLRDVMMSWANRTSRMKVCSVSSAPHPDSDTLPDQEKSLSKPDARDWGVFMKCSWWCKCGVSVWRGEQKMLWEWKSRDDRNTHSSVSQWDSPLLGFSKELKKGFISIKTSEHWEMCFCLQACWY